MTPANKLADDLMGALAHRDDLILMRNNNGLARYKDKHGKTHVVRYGLGGGSADFIACVDGFFFGIEIKAGRDTLRKRQLDWGRAIRRVKGAVITITEKNVEQASMLIDAELNLMRAR